LKKPVGLVRFYKLKTEKTKPNPNRQKAKPNRKNQAKPVYVLKNQTETGRFEPILVFFLKKIWFGYVFFIKTEPNRK
jgi:hypothetical protein